MGCRLPEGSYRHTESDPSEQEQYHVLTWNLPPFSNRFYLVLRVVQRRQKQSPEAEIQHPGRHTGRVEDRKASGPWQHPSGCGRQAQER